MENYFILLELSFDPPETNEKKISDAIAKKQQQWAKDMINPLKKAKASEYMAGLGEIKRVMSDPDARAKEAEKAKQIKAGKRKELEAKLELYRAKGNQLSDMDLKQLVRTFGKFGFSDDEIKKLFDSGKKSDDTVNPDEVLDKSLANKIKNFMRDLDMENKTLYDFLNLPPSSSCSQLCGVAEKETKKILAKGEKTGRDNVIQTLCGLCTTIFKDEKSKRGYDNYIKLTKYPAVNEAVDEIAKSNSKKIEPKMKESLIDIAVAQYHISVSDASIYINNYCMYMGYSLPENKVICGLCGAENPAGSTSCSKCGKALIIICPSCGAENNNSARDCARCGFDLTKMEQAVELLRQAKQNYADKDLDMAERLIKQAKIFWPGHPDIDSLGKLIADDRKKASAIIEAIDREINEKKFYSAKIKIDQAKASGFKIDDAVSSRVNQILSEVESGLDKIRNSTDDEAFKTIVLLSEIISDSDELNQSIKKFPPDECTETDCKRIGDAVTISWAASKSAGTLQYRLVRKENSYPNDPDDGAAIYIGNELSYTDQRIKKNAVFYYSVFVERLGVYSRAAKISESIAIVDKIENVRAIGGDAMITLSWDRSADMTEIRLWKYHGAEKPEDDSLYESVPCPRLDGLVLNSLENGTVYWFAISAGYTLNGKSYFSEKVYFSAVPQRPVKPLQDFEISMTDNIIRATWTQSEWDVILFCTKQKPDYAIGTIYDLEELSKYKKIDLNFKNITEAEFRLDFVGECYIIPGVINASNVILNAPCYVSAVPAVKDVSFDLNASKTEMYVNFFWPRKIDRAVLLYRMDEYPSGIEDPLAHRIECSKRQYEANAGIVINNPEEGIFYAEIFSYFENNDHRVYSDGVRALLSNEPQKDVLYSLKYKKAGLFSKTSKLTVEIETTGACVFPGFVVVGKYRSTPLKRNDGDIICSVDGSTEIKRSHTFEFNVDSLRSETRLKMFFLNDKNYKAFKIACKSGNII